MVEQIRKKRSKTARECAEYFGVTERAIRYRYAEPREEYLKRADEKKQQIFKLRATGMKIKDISETLNIPIGTVTVYISQAKKDGILEQKIIYKTPKKLSKK